MEIGRRVHRSKRLRAAVILLAVFHAGIAATAPVADALLELAAAGQGMHLESARDASCGDGHEHVFCELCRTTGLGAPPREAAQGYHGTVTATCKPSSSEGSVAARVSLVGSIGPRAPPLA